MRVVELSTEQTYPVRLTVLRAETASKRVDFAQDHFEGTVHLGIRNDDDELLAVSSWVPTGCAYRPQANAVQLRGMATVTAAHGRGLGSMLLIAGLARVRDLGADIVWANARDAALGFYLRHGFASVGDGFVDETTQLPHHVIVVDL